MGDVHDYRGIPFNPVIREDTNDPNGVYTLVRVANADFHGIINFTLPKASRFPYKTYVFRVDSLDTDSGDGLQVLPAVGDTVAGGSSTIVAAVGRTITLFSDGVSDWLLTGYYPGFEFEYVGTPAAGPLVQFPAAQAGGGIVPSALPVATTAALGSVKLIGTPHNAAAPVVPAITSANSPVNASITTDALVGKTIRVENGLITDFS